jgi:hypothetical protein
LTWPPSRALCRGKHPAGITPRRAATAANVSVHIEKRCREERYMRLKIRHATGALWASAADTPVLELPPSRPPPPTESSATNANAATMTSRAAARAAPAGDDAGMAAWDASA